MRLFLLILLSLVLVSESFAYTPPIGIPDPGDYWTTLHPIDTANPDTTTYCPGWYEGTPRANSTAAGDARNCYYVDNATGCTDSSNVYGYPGNARCTIPASNPSSAAHAAGTYFEVYGGVGRTAYAAWNPNFGEGTGANPIWMVGKNYPEFAGTFRIGYYTAQSVVSYVMLDGLYLTGRLKMMVTTDGQDTNHVCFRNGKVTQAAVDQGSAISMGTETSGFETWTGASASDIVIYNNDIGPIGVKTEAHQEFCGVELGLRSNRVFVLDNLVHDAVEDGICGGHAAVRTISDIYIGRNEIYDNQTNAIDLKHISGVVISENDISAYKNTTKADRWVVAEGVVVIHYAGDTPGGGANTYKNYPENVWFLFNTVHDADYGLVFAYTENLYALGNTFYNIHHETIDAATECDGANDPYDCCTGEGTGCTGDYGTWTVSLNASGAAIHARSVRGDAYIANNTIYDSDGGIMVVNTLSAYNAGTTYYMAGAVSNGGVGYYCINDNDGAGISGTAPPNETYWAPIRHYVTDNISSTRAESTFYDYGVASDTFLNEFDRNLAYNSSAISVYWINTVRDFDWVYGNTAFCGTDSNTCISGDPLFENAAGANFKLQAASPAKDKIASPSAAYTTFNTTYSRSIAYDHGLRPRSGTWDIGAYEYDPATVRSAMSIGAGAGVSIGSGATMTLY